MNRELTAAIESFESAQRRLEALAGRLTPPAWSRRPVPDRWSPIECVAHLNLTSTAFLPLLREGISRSRQASLRSPNRYHRDFWGWLIWHGVKTPGRFKTRTAASFVPSADRPPAEILTEFSGLQAELVECVRQCDGLAINRVTIVSPFDGRLKYSVYSALTILAAHQHRHLWQAEEASEGR